MKKKTTTKKAKKKVTVKDIVEPTTHLDKRIVNDLRELKSLVASLKENGYRVVLTQGVWDLIHEGHALYLEAAKKLGDVLIVGIDSDELTKKRKGPRRPIVPETERVRMISHLRHVDILTMRQANHDIGKLINVVQPDVLVVSSSTQDFTDKMKRDYEPVCGEVVNLQAKATATTSARIRNMTIEGAEKLAEEIHQLTDDFLNKIKNEG